MWHLSQYLPSTSSQTCFLCICNPQLNSPALTCQVSPWTHSLCRSPAHRRTDYLLPPYFWPFNKLFILPSTFLVILWLLIFLIAFGEGHCQKHFGNLNAVYWINCSSATWENTTASSPMNHVNPCAYKYHFVILWGKRKSTRSFLKLFLKFSTLQPLDAKTVWERTCTPPFLIQQSHSWLSEESEARQPAWMAYHCPFHQLDP